MGRLWNDPGFSISCGTWVLPFNRASTKGDLKTKQCRKQSLGKNYDELNQWCRELSTAKAGIHARFKLYGTPPLCEIWFWGSKHTSTNNQKANADDNQLTRWLTPPKAQENKHSDTKGQRALFWHLEPKVNNIRKWPRKERYYTWESMGMVY